MSNKLELIEEKNITDQVLNKVIKKQMSGALQLPADYSPQNALLSAWLQLQETVDREKKPVLEVCSKPSIANALMEMVVQGLNPVKNQVYFIAYGNQLQMQRSYLGTIAITKRLPGVKDVKGFPVYKTDEFKLGFDIATGRQTVETYVPSTNRKADELIGAFAIIYGEKELLHVEWMTMEQVRQAWNMGQTKGASPAHKGFPDQMAIKTVINRACKLYADTSDDSGLITGALQRQTDGEVDMEIQENANTELLEDGFPEPDFEVIDEDTGEFLEVEEEEPEDSKAPF